MGTVKIVAAVMLVSMLLGAAAATKLWFDNTIIEAENRGSKQCQYAVKDAEIEALRQKLTESNQLKAKEALARQAAVDLVRSTKDASKQRHLQLIEDLKGKTDCTIPDRTVDMINRPLAASRPAPAPRSKGGVK